MISLCLGRLYLVLPLWWVLPVSDFLAGFVQSRAPKQPLEFVRCAHPARNGEAPLLAAYPRRYASFARA
jgi:hypothetical protein